MAIKFLTVLIVNLTTKLVILIKQTIKLGRKDMKRLVELKQVYHEQWPYFFNDFDYDKSHNEKIQPIEISLINTS